MPEPLQSRRPLVVFTTCHSWIQEVVAEVAPPDFDTAFLDLDDEASVRSVLPEADFVVCLRLTAEHARLLKRCRLVMHNGVGYDGIAVDVLQEMGIPVAVTPAMTAEGVAEHSFMLLLAISRQLPALRASMASGEWNMLGWREHSHNLAYKTLGIVGLGRIGSRVAMLGRAFGCEVVYTDLVPAPEMEAAHQLRRMELTELIAAADLITVHVPLTELTQSMFGAAEFAAMKEGAIFINTSRGATYDIDALYDAVARCHLRGAGIDVYEPEPPPADHPILGLATVICTPHVASGTVERQYAINRAQFANCARILDGREPNDRIG